MPNAAGEERERADFHLGGRGVFSLLLSHLDLAVLDTYSSFNMDNPVTKWNFFRLVSMKRYDQIITSSKWEEFAHSCETTLVRLNPCNQHEEGEMLTSHSSGTVSNSSRSLPRHSSVHLSLPAVLS